MPVKHPQTIFSLGNGKTSELGECFEAIETDSGKKSSPQQMTDQDGAALVVAAQKYGTVRDRPLILFMRYTRVRTMEVCNLTRQDVQLGKQSGNVTVRSGKRNKHRDIPLNATTRAALEIYLPTLKEEGIYRFPSEKTGQRLGERALRYLIKKYMQLANLEGFRAYDLRHRFGYVMAECTPLHRLAQIMGHDGLDTTMIYVQAT